MGVGWQNVDSVHLDLNRVQWRAPVDTIMNLGSP